MTITTPQPQTKAPASQQPLGSARGAASAPSAPERATGIGERKDYHALNAQLNLFAPDGSIQFERDREAAREYFVQHVIPRTRRFESVAQRLEWLVSKEYYEAEFLANYSAAFLTRIHERAELAGHRFATFLGAFKFHASYALKSFDGETYLESFAERVVATALFLARGDERLAERLTDDMLSGRFQPATPTFLNAGKAQRGELVSCFLLRLEDNLESIGRSVNSALQAVEARRRRRAAAHEPA